MMRRKPPYRRLAMLSLALSAIAAPALAAPSPKPIDKASVQNGPDGSPITAEDLKELEAMTDAIGRFEAAQKDFRGTISHIVKQEYEKKRRELMARYEGQIKEAEKLEKQRREDAIVLFEKFLAKYPSDKRWTPDVIFRLAELYFEKTSDEYLASTATSAPGTTPPNADYTKTIDLYKRLITEFPQYRLIDGAYYLLGYCLDKMGNELEARQSFLALVCGNKYKALDKPEPVNASKGTRGVAFVDPYTECKPIKDDSRFNPEAWTRIGEYHFDYNELELAIAAYGRVLQYKDSPYYDKALYKLAWSYYRADRYPEAIKRFDELVVFSDKQKATSGKEGSDLRAESVQYLGISFAEKDWNGDTIDDPETGLQRAEAFYKGRESEPHVREIFQKLGDIYFDETEYNKAVEVYRRLLAKWPYAPDNPLVQDRIVLCAERLRDKDMRLKEIENLAKNYQKGGDWYEKNRNNKGATDAANERAEQALVKVAVEHHTAAQTFKKMAFATKPPDGKKLMDAQREYNAAAEAYAKYLELYANSRNAYEYTFFYAESLYYAQRFAEAAAQYEKVRDSNMDNKYLEDSAFAVIKSYEALVDNQVKSNKIVVPPLPETGKTTLPIQPKDIPDEMKKLQSAYDAYVVRVPGSSRLPTIAYKAAEIDFRYLHWDDARRRFDEILTKYPKDEVATQAGRAMLTSYTIENNLEKIVEWTDRLKGSSCDNSKNPAAPKPPWCTEIGILQTDAKFKQADKLFEEKKYEAAAEAYIKLVDADPTNKSGNNDKALNNAAVAYENVKRFAAATRIYERIVREYPSSSFVDDALFRTAVNYQRFFEFDKAVVSYQRLATDKRFAGSQHRTDAIYNSAVLLENDQNYDAAAKMFQGYAASTGVKKEEAAEAYFRSGLIYMKNKDAPKAIKTFQSYLKTYPGDAKRTLEAQYHIAEALELQKDKAGAFNQYKKIAAAGASVPAASDAAEYPAKAAFLLAEQDLAGVEKMKLVVDKNFAKSRARYEEEIKRMTGEYNKVIAYRRATWTLAAYFRIGYLYELYSKALASLINSPCPSEVMAIQRKQERAGVTNTEELACTIYTDQIRAQIEPVVASVDEEVVKRYRTTLEQAAKLGVSNEWTKLARQKANAYKPDEFPMTKDERVDFQMESPQ